MTELATGARRHGGQMADKKSPDLVAGFILADSADTVRKSDAQGFSE